MTALKNSPGPRENSNFLVKKDLTLRYVAQGVVTDAAKKKPSPALCMKLLAANVGKRVKYRLALGILKVFSAPNVSKNKNPLLLGLATNHGLDILNLLQATSANWFFVFEL